MSKDFTEKQKQDLLAIADIVENGDLAVLKKIVSFQESLNEMKSEIETFRTEMSDFLKTDKPVTQVNTDVANRIQDLSLSVKESEYSFRKLLNDARQVSETDISALSQKLSDEIARVRASIPQMPSMPDLGSLEQRILSYCDEKMAQMMPMTTTVAEKMTPEMIRDGLESLEGDSRLDKKAVKGIEELEKEIAALKKMKGQSSTVYVGSGGGSHGGRIVRAYDLSSQLNGVLKTFALPACWRVISVHSSSSPFSFRETTDYTWNTSSISFTSEISASTTLATGQTITVVYSEA